MIVFKPCNLVVDHQPQTWSVWSCPMMNWSYITVIFPEKHCQAIGYHCLVKGISSWHCLLSIVLWKLWTLWTSSVLTYSWQMQTWESTIFDRWLLGIDIQWMYKVCLPWAYNSLIFACVWLCFIMFAYWSWQKLVVLSWLIGKMGTFPRLALTVCLFVWALPYYSLSTPYYFTNAY